MRNPDKHGEVKTPMSDAHDRAIIASSEEARGVKHECLTFARRIERQLANLELQISTLRQVNAAITQLPSLAPTDHAELVKQLRLQQRIPGGCGDPVMDAMLNSIADLCQKAADALSTPPSPQATQNDAMVAYYLSFPSHIEPKKEQP